jgi:rSAM/selenodomain-associated transferase 1
MSDTVPAAECAIVVMAKASQPGRVKTRLVPPLSAAQAADLNTAFLCDAADNLLAAAKLAAISGWVAHAPQGSAEFFRRTVPGLRLLETAAPDLGACLLLAAAAALDAGHRAVCLINSDSPTLPARYLAAAATLLAQDGERVVLGPTTDGGYYLIGIKRAHAQLFRDIEWSSPRVLCQTLAKARQLALPIIALPAWYDVDDLHALRMLSAELFAGRPFRAADDDRRQRLGVGPAPALGAAVSAPSFNLPPDLEGEGQSGQRARYTRAYLLSLRGDAGVAAALGVMPP